MIRSRRRSLSLAEAVVSMTIVGVTLVAAVTTIGASRLTMRQAGDRTRARLWAQTLLDEILIQPYADLGDTPVFGPESGEAGGTRQNFDDVDDYHNWSASPPEDRDGVPLPHSDGWSRKVQVSRVNPMNPEVVLPVDLGASRITVTVERNDVSHATLTAIRTSAAFTSFIRLDPPDVVTDGLPFEPPIEIR